MGVNAGVVSWWWPLFLPGILLLVSFVLYRCWLLYPLNKKNILWPWSGVLPAQGDRLLDAFWSCMTPEADTAHYWLEKMDPARMALFLQQKIRQEMSWLMEQLLDTGTELVWEKLPQLLRRQLAQQLRQHMQRSWDDLMEELVAHADTCFDFPAFRRAAWEIAVQDRPFYAQILASSRWMYGVWAGSALILGLLLWMVQTSVWGRSGVLLVALCCPWLSCRWIWLAVVYREQRGVEIMRTWVLKELLTTSQLMQGMQHNSGSDFGRILDRFVHQVVHFEGVLRYWPGWPQHTVVQVVRRNLRQQLDFLLDNAFASTEWSQRWQLQLSEALPSHSEITEALCSKNGLGGLLSIGQALLVVPWAAIAAWVLANSFFFR